MFKKINVAMWIIFLMIFIIMGFNLYKVQQEQNALVSSYVQSISNTALSKTLIEFGKTEKYKYTDKDIINILEESTFQSVIYFVENNITLEEAKATVFNNSKLTLNSPLLTKEQKEKLEKYLDIHSKAPSWNMSDLIRQINDFF